MSFPSIPEPTSPRWRPLRAGIQNLWQYDDHRFVFHHGRLLLRGRNESGKSKALELLLPFLLDADLSPQRLDPFGSTSRQMRWNLLNDDNPEVQTAVGYVWIEFGMLSEEGPKTCTIGAGLRARRSRSDVESWYFLTDQRPDEDLHLVDAARTPLSPGRLEEALGSHGRLFRNRGDYKTEVNRRLFGMPGEQYEALIEALLQLRRPQLSKQLQPAELSRILSVSLPPLDGGVIGRLAEGFDRLERHRHQRDEAAGARDALSGFLTTYRHYVEAAARDRAGAVVGAETSVQAARAAVREALEAASAAAAAREAVEARGEALRGEREDLETRIAAWKESEAWRGVQELHGLEQQARAQALAVEQAGRRSDQAAEDLARRQTELDAALAAAQAVGDALSEAGRRALDAADKADLSGEHAVFARALPAGDPSALRGQVSAVAQARSRAIEELQRLQRALDKAQATCQLAEHRLNDAEEAHAAALAAHQEGIAAAARAEATFTAAVEAWADGLAILDLSADQREALADAPVDSKREIALAATDAQRAALMEAVTAEKVSQTGLRAQLREILGEQDRLQSATHHPPGAPHWRSAREQRPGAPLYLLCEFRPEVAPAVQAGVEAALESAGILDAWVTPNGALLDKSTHDVLLIDGPPVAGPGLDALLLPTPTGGVPAEVVAGLLRRVGLGEGPGAAWVDGEGRWAMGPLRGQWAKPELEYIGETAREAARQRRLAELATRAEAVKIELSAVEDRLRQLSATRASLDSELAAFPGLDPIRRARAELSAAARALHGAQERVQERRAQVETARDAQRTAQTRLASRAGELGLLAWASELEALSRLSQQWSTLALQAIQQLGELRRAGAAFDRATAEQARTRIRLDEARDQQAEAARLGRSLSVRLEALRVALGADPEEILRQVGQAETRREAVLAELGVAERLAVKAAEEVGAKKTAVEGAEGQLQQREAGREGAAEHFRQLVGTGILSAIDLESTEIATWTQVLELARLVMKAVGQVDGSAQALERAENRVASRHRELQAGLGAVVSVRPRRADSLLVYEGSFNGRESGLAALVRALDEDVAARDRLLSERERGLFETFLSGETHAHLRERLREAHSLVDEMNEQLTLRPTAGGTRLRLDWSITEGAPAGTQDAIGLLLRSSTLISERDREALGRFLRQRLDEARATDGLGSLRDKLLAVLDYRSWYSFTIQFQAHGQGGWRKLTKKAHGAGSGGQKAVMLHLPLFAAASAFYRSAAPTSPRLIVLDEAFAGIDRAMRGQLMGMLAVFELDFVMTSHEEWGFYEELDGLAAYHLARERDLPGVYADRFVWEGGVVHELGSA